MVSDGVTDALGEENADARMEGMILKQQSTNPRELANNILSEVLAECGYNPNDDMTVLAFGVWKK